MVWSGWKQFKNSAYPLKLLQLHINKNSYASENSKKQLQLQKKFVLNHLNLPFENIDEPKIRVHLNCNLGNQNCFP